MLRHLKEALHRRSDRSHRRSNDTTQAAHGQIASSSLKDGRDRDGTTRSASNPAPLITKPNPIRVNDQRQVSTSAERNLSPATQKTTVPSKDGVDITEHPAVRPLNDGLAPRSPAAGSPNLKVAPPATFLPNKDRASGAGEGLDTSRVKGKGRKTDRSSEPDRIVLANTHHSLPGGQSSSTSAGAARGDLKGVNTTHIGKRAGGQGDSSEEEELTNHLGKLAIANENEDEETQPITPPPKIPELDMPNLELNFDDNVTPLESTSSVDHTVHTRPPVTHEEIKPHVHTIYHPVHTRSIHIHEHRLIIQPIIDTSSTIKPVQPRSGDQATELPVR